MQMAKNKIFSALLTLLMLVAVLPINGYAIDPIDLEAKTSLTMVFCPDDRAAEGSEFQIWRVGEPDRFCNFTKTETFAPYDVAVSDLTAEGWADLAVTLAGYAARDEIAPDATAVVDEDGNAVFSDLPTGLYLVTGDAYRRGRYTYTPSPIMVSLPSRDEQEQWHYDVTANAKYTEKHIPGSGSSKTDLKVVKVWEDDGKEFRPTEAVIQLLKDGKVYDTVTLNEDNNWRHTWTDMSKSATWQVVEKTVPEGYEVLVSNDSLYSFTVTNSTGEEIPPGPPPPLSPPPPEEPPPGNPPPNLPQTGMLWWPVPVLAVSGMVCFLAGWVKKRKENDHEA